MSEKLKFDFRGQRKFCTRLRGNSCGAGLHVECLALQGETAAGQSTVE